MGRRPGSPPLSTTEQRGSPRRWLLRGLAHRGGAVAKYAVDCCSVHDCDVINSKCERGSRND